MLPAILGGMLRLLVVIVALSQMPAAVPAAPSAPSCGSCCEHAVMPDGNVAPPCCSVAPERPQERATLSVGRAASGQPSPAVGPLVALSRWLPLVAPRDTSAARSRHRRFAVLRI
jgi:hypothetical protein